MFNDYHIRCRNDIKQTIIVFCNNNLFEVTDVAANDDYIADSDDIVDGFAYAMLMLSQMLLLLLSLMVLMVLLLTQ